MHIRDGIKFHDGTPLDGAAVKFNIDTCRASPLTGAALPPIDNVDASGQDVTITIQGGPWVALPRVLRATASAASCSRRSGWAACRTCRSATEGSPVYDAALAATPADGDPPKPVGLGAFKFESYTPGNGNVVQGRPQPRLLAGPEGHHR